jgi:5'-3' exonuclease
VTRSLLVDADIVAYKVSFRCEDKFSWGDTGDSTVVDEVKALRETNLLLKEYCDLLDADRIVVCLSDPDANFRKQYNESYKSNRKDVVAPQLLMYVKHYLANEYQSFIRPRLEADDIMGILATSGDKFVKGDKIIVSEDKDMRTIPAKVYHPHHKELGVLDISRLDADRFLLWQVLTGDATDGYPGCPGIGPKSVYAEEIIGADREELWDIVLEAYASKGMTEDDAILQARMAHILRAESYNFKTKKIRLWQPEWLL